MRGASVLLGAAVLAGLLAGCDRTSADDRAAPSLASVQSEPLEPALDEAVLGVWSAYDDVSNEQLGDAFVGKEFIRFDKASLMRLVPVAALSADVGIGAEANLCGDKPVMFVTFQVVDHPRPQSLKIAVYDQPPGPAADPNFDPHRCQVFTYVRE